MGRTFHEGIVTKAEKLWLPSAIFESGPHFSHQTCEFKKRMKSQKAFMSFHFYCLLGVVPVLSVMIFW